MGTYTVRDNVTGEIVDIAEATNLQAARAAAAARRFDVGLSTANEILEWGKSGKDLSAPRTRKKKPAFVDPNKTNILDGTSAGTGEAPAEA